jgi:glycosyltransferase involved in cell wall biosynthesis
MRQTNSEALDRIGGASAQARAAPVVAIFRIELFKPSETFIASQVRNLRRYRPVFVGRLDHPVPAGFRASPLPSNRWSWLWTLLGRSREAGAALAGVNAAVVHAHFATDGAVIAPYAAALNTPLVVTLHGFDVAVTRLGIARSRNPTLVYSYFMRRRLFAYADTFLCVSKYIYDLAVIRNFPKNKLLLHYIGIDLETLRPANEWQEDKIVHIGRLVEKKGTEYLIKAMPAVLRQRPNAKLLILGSGPLAAELGELASSLKLSEHVIFAGETTHAQAMQELATATVACAPSVTARNGDSEGLPTVVLEAAALAVPVVASRTSGIPEAVLDGVTGYLAPERDVDALAKALLTILGDKAKRAQMGAAGRLYMEQKFDQRKQTEQLEEIYDGLQRGRL